MKGSSRRLGSRRLVATMLCACSAALAVMAACSDDPPAAVANTAPDAASPDTSRIEIPDKCADAAKPTRTCTAQECTTKNGGEPSVCVEGACVKLKTDECTAVYGPADNDDAIVIGSLFSTRGTDALNGIPRERAAALAVKELNAVGGIYTADGCGRRPLVYVACDDSNALINPSDLPDGGKYDRKKAAQHLTGELKVAGILGGMNTNNTLAATAFTFPTQTALFPPSASAVSLTQQDGGKVDGTPLIWRLSAGDDYQVRAMIEVGNEVATLINKPTTMKVAILYRDDAFGIGGANEMMAKLTVNGKAWSDPANASLVFERKYPIVGDIPATVVADTYTFMPDLIYYFGQGEFSKGFLAPYEDKIKASGGTKPQYVTTKSGQRQDALDVMSTRLDVNIKSRFRGTSDFIITPLMQSFFNIRYKAEHPDTPALLAGMPNSYDGAYLLAYAIQATKPSYERVAGVDVAKSVSKLIVGTPVDVGPSSVQAALEGLRSGGTIDFNGTSGPFDYDPTTGNLPGDFATWCVKTDPNTSQLTYENVTGQVWHYADGKLQGTFVCPN
jgi:ABC-type branched-subunit amino acid transport system substrate-binding protein